MQNPLSWFRSLFPSTGFISSSYSPSPHPPGRKQPVSALLLLAGVPWLAALTPAAHADQSGDFIYTKSGAITGYTGPGGAVVIPATIAGLTMRAIDNAFTNNTAITSVTISGNVTSIGDFAFSGCTGLTGVTIPAGVTSIGFYAFQGCTALLNMEAAPGNTVYKSAGGVLFNPEETVLWLYPGGRTGPYIIPAGVTSIGETAFSGCTGLTGVTIPAGVTSIGSYAFHGCTALLNMEAAPGNTAYKSAGGVLFNAEETVLWRYPGGRTGPYTIPAGVTSIAGHAFSGCTGLTGVTIPAGVTSIGSYAFQDCDALLNMEVAPGNAAYKSVGGVLFNPKETALLNYPGGRTGSYTIPAGVTSIGDGAFHSCGGLTGVTIPASVTSIGGEAFSGCTGLTGVTIPAGVTFIGYYAFSYCTGLTGITIPAGITYIGGGAFQGCTGLTGVTIPGNVTFIGDHAFQGCTGLTGVTILAGVTSIGGWMFFGCTSLTSVTIPASVTSIGGYAFHGCTALLNMEVAPGNTVYKSVGGVLFNPEETDLRRYPSGRTGPYTIPAGVTSIAGYAFSGCAGLTGVTIPASVTSIGGYAFQGCTALLNMEVAPGNTVYKSVGGVLFNTKETILRQYPEGRTGPYTIPAGVTSIGGGAFHNCGGLTSITISASVTSIGGEAFQFCSHLTGVTIPSGVTSIGQYAFGYCPGLKAVLFEGNAPQNFFSSAFAQMPPGFTISYYEGAVGFTSPRWRGYASVAVPRPVDGGAFRVESLTLQSGVAILRVSGGRRGWTYTLQRGADLSPAFWQSVGTVGPVIADGALELTDPAPPQSRAFYRVTGQSP
ncbi:MAG: leucine-rich repeat domain-containing protein [Verrucomicrobiota bacterium]